MNVPAWEFRAGSGATGPRAVSPGRCRGPRVPPPLPGPSPSGPPRDRRRRDRRRCGASRCRRDRRRCRAGHHRHPEGCSAVAGRPVAAGTVAAAGRAITAARRAAAAVAGRPVAAGTAAAAGRAITAARGAAAGAGRISAAIGGERGGRCRPCAQPCPIAWPSGPTTVTHHRVAGCSPAARIRSRVTSASTGPNAATSPGVSREPEDCRQGNGHVDPRGQAARRPAGRPAGDAGIVRGCRGHPGGGRLTRRRAAR